MQPHRNFDGNLAETLPVFTWDDLTADLKTRSAWRRKRRKVRKGAKPVARLTWDQILAQNADATVTNPTEQRVFARECGLYSFEQTAPYQGTARTLAVEIFWRYYVEKSSRQYHICWAKGHWNTCRGRLDDARLKSHLNGKERYGIRGGDSTRFLAVDLDLHDGDPNVFLDQLRVLLGEFHGKNGWHFQVADENAGGIHLIRCFRHDVRLEPLRKHFRKRLQELDQRHPELAVSARAAGMKTLGELEIFPDTQKGFRLPLCLGRTMLLDRPLPLVFNKRMSRDVQDVLGYVTWLSRGQKTYMPADEVIQFVQQRLKPVAPKPKAQRVVAKKPDSNSAISEMADFGPMKGQYRQKLVEFWTGKNTPPDSLNKGIALLARLLPFYLDDEEAAVGLVERFIDELPDHSFSDRLSREDRAEISRIVRNTVGVAYHGNGGQADPEASTEKLQATVAAWKKRGFDPTDKGTWGTVNNIPDVPVINFEWTEQEVIKLGLLQKALNTSLHATKEAVAYLLSLVKHHNGEIAISLAKIILEGFGINCGHHGKVNKLMSLLLEWDWLYLRSREMWHGLDENGKKRKGRARAYGIGAVMLPKFEQSSTTTNKEYLYIVSHLEKPLEKTPSNTQE